MGKNILNNTILSISISGFLISIVQIFLGNIFQFIVYNIFFLIVIIYLFQIQKQNKKELQKDINKCYKDLNELISYRNTIPNTKENYSFLNTLNYTISQFEYDLEYLNCQVFYKTKLTYIFTMQKQCEKLDKAILQLRCSINETIMKVISFTINMNTQKFKKQYFNTLNYNQALELLEIDKTQLSKTYLKKKYRELVKLYHPDNGGNIEKFNQIHNAYELVLSQIK